MNGFNERRWTSRDGLSLHARDYVGASGPARLPVVCLHGLTRNGRDFEDVAPFIAGLGRRVVVPDVRGRGRSQWDPDPAHYTPQTYGRDVIELMDALGIGRAIFVGTSMGGIIMMLLAARHRARIAGNVLNDVGPEVGPDGLARIRSYVGQSVLLNSWSDAVSYVRRINGPALPHYTNEDWDRFARRTMVMDGERPILDYDPAISGPLKSGSAGAPAFLAWLLFRRLVKHRPTLIVRGANSDILTRATAGRMQAVARASTLVEVPGVGHAPTLDEPVVRAALAEFFKTAP